jgi:hypothetical protein
VNGIPTKAEEEGDIDNNERVGHEAKQIKRGCKKVNPRLDSLDCRPSIIFINHAVTKIVTFGKKSDSGGGHGIKFYAHVRLAFSHLGWIKESDGRRIGQKIKVEIEKLKGGEVEFPKIDAICTNEYGFDNVEGLKEAMLATGFAYLPKGGRAITILRETGLETQVKTTMFREWVEEQGGYNKVYSRWRAWAISRGFLKPWGGKDV